MKFAVVVVGYNRPAAMSRLLNSIMNADYQGDTVDLVISLDKGARQAELVEIAEKVEWKHGEKKVRVFPERQGLRPHILQCGDLTNADYDAVAVLEDDLLVSSGFYAYCKQMVSFYDDDNRIAGISLYKHRIHPGARRPFEPEEDAHDVYFMQMAQSWGQCWTTRMWKGFRTWYEDNQGEITESVSFPCYISQWNHASWMKYYNKYVVEQDLYYVYPYKSLTTNHTEVGEHSSVSNNDFQVPLLSMPMEYRCVSVKEGVKYDIFLERVELKAEYLSKYRGKVMLDLMGTRSRFDGADVLISVQQLPYKVLDELQLRYRPVETNVSLPHQGKGIFVYDLHMSARKPKCNSRILVSYDIRGIKPVRAFWYVLGGMNAALVRKVKKLKKKLLR